MLEASSRAPRTLAYLLHFSLLNCTRVRDGDGHRIAEACVSGRMKKERGRKEGPPYLYRRPAYAMGMAKKGGARGPHRVRARAKMPKHNITVLFTAVNVNMRDYERRAARNVQP